MSRQLVFAAAGAVIGFYVGGPAGARYGFVAGSLIGAATTPGPHSEGPRISDLAFGTSTYGSTIPYLVGTNRVAGSAVWASAKHETSSTSSSGKGGGASSTSYSYDMDLLILLSENEIAGVTRVWSDGKLVWTSGATTGPWTRMTVYTGDVTQLPDPTYEAAVGTANAPAYRGRGSVFIQGLQLPNGNVPNLTFEVVQKFVTTDPVSSRIVASGGGGTAGYACAIDPITGYVWTQHRISPSYYIEVYDPIGQAVVATLGPFANNVSSFTPVIYCDATGEMWFSGDYDKKIVNTTTYSVTLSTIAGTIAGYNPARRVIYFNDSGITEVSADTKLVVSGPSVGTIAGGYMASKYCANLNIMVLCRFEQVRVVNADTNLLLFSGTSPEGASTDFPGTLTYDPTRHLLYTIGSSQNVVIFNCVTFAFTLVALPAQSGFIGGRSIHYHAPTDRVVIGWTLSNRFSVYTPVTFALLKTSLIDPTLNDQIFNIVDAPGLPDQVYATNAYGLFRLYLILLNNAVNPSLAEVVTALCLRAGMSASQFDVSGITSITKPVRGFAISTATSTRNSLETLMSAYFFSAVLSDKLYFVARGGSVAATLPYAALGVGADGSHDPLPLTRRSELELPAQLALTYIDAANDYQPDTQYSDRLLTGQTSVTAVQVPLVFNASEAKAITDVLLTDAIGSALKTTIAVSLAYTRLEPTDIVVATDAAGNTFRFRIMQRTESAGALTLGLELDDPSALVAVGVTSASAGGQTVVVVIPNTAFRALDIPLLRDADDYTGLYVAVRAEGAGTGWSHGAIYDSMDNLTFAPVVSISNQAVIGQTVTVLANWTGGNVFDESNTVTVSTPNQELSSATAADIFNNSTLNAAVIGSELVQFKQATLVSAGVYTLSGLLRGRRGTEWAMASHAFADRFVALGTSGMRYLRLDNADLGAPRYYRAASASQFVADLASTIVTPTGEPLRPLSGVDARADRTTTDTVVTWKRRTRLSTRLVGSLAISAPLGEATESYEVEVWNSSYTTLKRTITATTGSVTYTAAQQTTDFGSGQTTLYLRIYQLAAVVGRGHVFQVTV